MPSKKRDLRSNVHTIISDQTAIRCSYSAGRHNVSSAGIVVSHIAAWAPGLDSSEDWKQWAAGTKQIKRVKDAPKIEYTDPLFRRRLSQISRMTIEVVHRELEDEHCSPDIKQVFISIRGEIIREFSISTMFIDEKMILPELF